jgi:hypothetical protein
MKRHTPYSLQNGDQFSLSGQSYKWEVVQILNAAGSNKNAKTNTSSTQLNNESVSSQGLNQSKVKNPPINDNNQSPSQQENKKMDIQFILSSENKEVTPPLFPLDSDSPKPPLNEQNQSEKNNSFSENNKQTNDSISVRENPQQQQQQQQQHTTLESNQMKSLLSPQNKNEENRSLTFENKPTSQNLSDKSFQTSRRMFRILFDYSIIKFSVHS